MAIKAVARLKERGRKSDKWPKQVVKDGTGRCKK